MPRLRRLGVWAGVPCVLAAFLFVAAPANAVPLPIGCGTHISPPTRENIESFFRFEFDRVVNYSAVSGQCMNFPAEPLQQRVRFFPRQVVPNRAEVARAAQAPAATPRERPRAVPQRNVVPAMRLIVEVQNSSGAWQGLRNGARVQLAGRALRARVENYGGEVTWRVSSSSHNGTKQLCGTSPVCTLPLPVGRTNLSAAAGGNSLTFSFTGEELPVVVEKSA